MQGLAPKTGDAGLETGKSTRLLKKPERFYNRPWSSRLEADLRGAEAAPTFGAAEASKKAKGDRDGNDHGD